MTSLISVNYPVETDVRLNMYFKSIVGSTGLIIKV